MFVGDGNCFAYGLAAKFNMDKVPAFDSSPPAAAAAPAAAPAPANDALAVSAPEPAVPAPSSKFRGKGKTGGKAHSGKFSKVIPYFASGEMREREIFLTEEAKTRLQDNAPGDSEEGNFAAFIIAEINKTNFQHTGTGTPGYPPEFEKLGRDDSQLLFTGESWHCILILGDGSVYDPMLVGRAPGSVYVTSSVKRNYEHLTGRSFELVTSADFIEGPIQPEGTIDCMFYVLRAMSVLGPNLDRNALAEHQVEPGELRPWILELLGSYVPREPSSVNKTLDFSEHDVEEKVESGGSCSSASSSMLGPLLEDLKRAIACAERFRRAANVPDRDPDKIMITEVRLASLVYTKDGHIEIAPVTSDSDSLNDDDDSTAIVLTLPLLSTWCFLVAPAFLGEAVDDRYVLDVAKHRKDIPGRFGTTDGFDVYMYACKDLREARHLHALARRETAERHPTQPDYVLDAENSGFSSRDKEFFAKATESWRNHLAERTLACSTVAGPGTTTTVYTTLTPVLSVSSTDSTRLVLSLSDILYIYV